ncbi:hypothetical protein L2734_17315 [Parashewanella spongiae]|nr:hypothetical protein [Parashewanella spongiae]MCL1079898.1 hypothetical protein [Parashewanella spongiae]
MSSCHSSAGWKRSNDSFVVGSLGSVDLSGLNFVLFEHLSVQGVSSDA